MTAIEAVDAKLLAGAAAVGLLRALLSLGLMPAAHRESAEEIVTNFRNAKITEKVAA